MLALMRSPHKRFLLLCFIITILASGCTNESERSSFINDFALNIKKKEMTIEQVYNSYNGVPYEGESLYKISFVQVDTDSIFDVWNDIPLSEDIHSFLYNTVLDEPTRAENIHLPEIKNGKWAFLDRGTTNFDFPSTYNFSLCIWDYDNGVAYYYKIDT